MIHKTLYFKCKFCNTDLQIGAMSGWLMLNGKLWSDGLAESAFYNKPFIVCKCANCNSALCVEKSQEEITRQTAINAKNVEIGDYLDILNTRIFSIEEQKQFRIKHWQWRNGSRKEDIELNKNSFNEKDLQNLNELCELLDMNINDELLMIAEIKREIGDFKECVKLLEPIKEDFIAKQIIEMANIKCASLFELQMRPSIEKTNKETHFYTFENEYDAANKLYKRAAELANSDSRFLLLSTREQSEQFTLVACAMANIDFKKYFQNKLLKKDLDLLLKTMQSIYGIIEPSLKINQALDIFTSIDEYKKDKDFDYVLIENSNNLNICEDEEYIVGLQEFAQMYNVETEVYSEPGTINKMLAIKQQWLDEAQKLLNSCIAN